MFRANAASKDKKNMAEHDRTGDLFTSQCWRFFFNIPAMNVSIVDTQYGELKMRSMTKMMEF